MELDSLSLSWAHHQTYGALTSPTRHLPDENEALSAGSDFLVLPSSGTQWTVHAQVLEREEFGDSTRHEMSPPLERRLLWPRERLQCEPSWHLGESQVRDRGHFLKG